MVMVSSSLPRLSIEGKLIIFPRYTYYLQENGCKIEQRNDKLSNRKLNEYLMNANLASVLNETINLPDVAIYTEGVWKQYSLNKYDKVQLDAGKFGNYIYYPNILEYAEPKSTVNMLIGFLNLYSSAKMKINQR